MGAGVEPGETSTKTLDLQVSALKIGIVDVSDFQLAARRRFHRLGDLDHIVVVEVQAGNGITGFRRFRFFFDRKGTAIAVEINHAEALGVLDPVAEHGGAGGAFCRVLQLFAKVLTMEDVVAQDQAHRVIANELFANQKGLGQTVR
ncbi:hypothetical protein D3C84_517060 [compost metagenome]